MKIDLNKREAQMLLECIHYMLCEIDMLPQNNSLVVQMAKENKEGYEKLREKILSQI